MLSPSGKSEGSAQSDAGMLSENDCTHEKIIKGHYIDALTSKLKKLGAYYPENMDIDDVESAKKKTDDIQTSAYDVINKVANYWQPMEQNLLVAILFKIFQKIDQRVAKRFNVLAALTYKLRTKLLYKDDVIVQPDESLDTINIVYAGQIKQWNKKMPEQEPVLLQAEDIIGQFNIKERMYPRKCSLEARVVSKEAKILTLSL